MSGDGTAVWKNVFHVFKLLHVTINRIQNNRGLTTGMILLFTGRWAITGRDIDETLLKMGSQTYIFSSNVRSKCRECRLRDPKFKTFLGEHAPGPPLPYNCVVTMASPSLNSWLRY